MVAGLVRLVDQKSRRYMCWWCVGSEDGVIGTEGPRPKNPALWMEKIARLTSLRLTFSRDGNA